jgi:transcriptional regulator with XRE-family HTH domain
MVRGRKPNLERRQQAQELRAQGLTQAQIAARLHCTRQAVSLLLRGQALIRPVCCRVCERVILPPRKGTWANRPALCLDCLAARPEAPFRERLQAFRLSRGLTQRELAEQTGVAQSTIMNWETTQRSRLDWTVLRKLLAFFRPALVWLEAPKGGKRRTRQREGGGRRDESP